MVMSRRNNGQVLLKSAAPHNILTLVLMSLHSPGHQSSWFAKLRTLLGRGLSQGSPKVSNVLRCTGVSITLILSAFTPSTESISPLLFDIFLKPFSG